ncbi:hypothetical protein SDC9_92712 [bioreactor metagenome]|uniref:Carbohydrate-binding domain-containing protein n=1 Tax=bioreactor metagenome TaxID=1076179 RepID=A0A644ZZY5_9ZZZZ
MTLSCGSTAFAAVFEHNIDDGDLKVTSDNCNADGYLVYSLSGHKSNHKIIVNGAKTTITLDSVKIETTDGKSAIDIGDDADVELIISGVNSLTVNNTVTGYGTDAGIHISGGSLTISGTDADDDTLVINTGLNGAAIGSNGVDPNFDKTWGEDFTGTIVIDSGVTVNANSKYASGIGSGSMADMSGEITVNGGTVNTNSEWASGIGSGVRGKMSGDITVNGGTVNANCVYDSSGIGSGYHGEMNGDITINGGDITAKSEHYGAGIGCGASGDMSGTITINGGNVIAESGYDGAGIGTGDANFGEKIYDMSGQININGGIVTATSANGQVGIGAGSGSIASGDITIHGDTVITLGDDNAIGAKGESEGTIYIYKGAVINGITVSDSDELKDAGILNDNMGAEIVENTSTYSLGKLNNVSRINAAKAGDTVYVYESELSKGKLPYYVLEALAKSDNVTLVVVGENGETAEIKSSSVPEKGKNAFFTIDELLEMVK